MKYALIGLALLFSGAAQAQSCPYAAPGQTSGVVLVSRTITLNATPYQIIDCSAFRFTATTEVNPMFAITGYDALAVIKLGVLEGSAIAGGAIDLSNFEINELDITSIQNFTANGIWAHNGALAVFDNKISIGGIRQVLGNGLLAYEPSNNATYNFQGNHVEIGQIIGSNASGIALFPGAAANTFIVGPIEHNAAFGCYDGASASVPASLKNIWIVNGANTNGVPAGGSAAC
jgi:hypothetical protein